MTRFAIVAAGLLMAALSGCTTCQNPWDYCNSVLGCGGCPYCDYGARCGSAFAPIGATPPTTELGPTEAGRAGETAEPIDTPEYSPAPDDPMELFNDAPDL